MSETIRLKKKMPPKKKEEKVVVEEEKVEEIPIPVEEEKVEQFNLNQARVIFPKLPVKKIVSYHSGTILAEKEPSIELSDEKYQEVLDIFQRNAVDGVIPATALPELMIQMGSYDQDLPFLTSIIGTKLNLIFEPLNPSPPPPPSLKDTSSSPRPTETPEKVEKGRELNEQKFIQFFLYFYAPAFYYGQRLRMYAGRGEKDQVKELLYRHCQVNSANGEGLTALHYAAEANQVEIIDLLIDVVGVDNLAINAQDKYGWTPLHCAAHNGHLATVVKLLSLPGIEVDLPNNMGKTALHLASAQNRSLIASKLLEAGAVLTATDKRGMTPLHETTYRGRVNLYQEYIRDPRSDVNLLDHMGKVAADYLTTEEMKN